MNKLDEFFSIVKDNCKSKIILTCKVKPNFNGYIIEKYSKKSIEYYNSHYLLFEILNVKHSIEQLSKFFNEVKVYGESYKILFKSKNKTYVYDSEGKYYTVHNN